MGVKVTRVSRRIELPPNMLRLIASKINDPKTLASLALSHKQMAMNLKKRMESIRQRRRKHARSPTARGVPRGAPPAKRRRV